MAKTNVLVVEDESIVSKDIQYSLKKLGYNVVGAASTGEKAFELAATKNPDIILMDIMLKGDINGIQTAERVKKELHIPVIYLTAYADEATLAKAKITERGVKISSTGIVLSLNKFSIISDSCSSIDPSSSPISAMAVISALLTFILSSSEGESFADKASLNQTNGNVNTMRTLIA